ncbi:hypothetical protein F5148DRAFT_1369878 [Russula earlei]|uniref:Uncharacterized protein n=1 Tax=Russula earlei TaxID=71964 RepID=A0ACC0TZV7_9AGAM|nr:hypothetical protein F5148DRAFT_1369878 [Russula earlei]
MPESLLLCAARSLTTIDGPSQVSLQAGPIQVSITTTEQWSLDRVTINTLPDDALLEIFDFYVNQSKTGTNRWHALIHVCHRWRPIVFASPRHLNLRLEYTGKRPMSEMLDVWPVLPVAIRSYQFLSDWENIIGALESEHRHRICEIHLSEIPASHWGRSAAAIQKPFPELTDLTFSPEGTTATAIPDPLGGSAPLLRVLWLKNCPFQGLPKLLLSAKQLVDLYLWDLPDSGYISPQDLGTALSVMSRLKTLWIHFRSPLYLASRPRPPLTRSVLPALKELEFHGVPEYLENLLAQIEVPFLTYLHIMFFEDPEFVLPQLHRLICHAKSFETCDRATVCSSTFPLLSNLIQLEFEDYVSHWIDNMETTQWLELIETTQWLEFLDPFIAVKDLHLSRRVAPHVCRALEELAEETLTDVLPALQNIYMSGREPLEEFVTARNLSGHPVAVHCWA